MRTAWVLSLIVCGLAILQVAGPSPLHAQCGQEDQMLLDPTLLELDAFGRSVAIHGDLAVIGAPGDEGPASARRGRVYTYRQVNGVWQFESQLNPAGAKIRSKFGGNVATNGNWILASAASGNPGKVFFYGFNGKDWVLFLEHRGPFQFYGGGLDMDGDWAAVADWQGSVDLFHFDGSFWSWHTKLTSPAAGFGGNVAMHEDQLVVLASGVPPGGELHVYQLTGMTWNFVQSFAPADATFGELFGTSLDIHDDVVVAGAPWQTGVDIAAGATYIWRHDGVAWGLDTKLIEPGGGRLRGWYGYSLAVEDDHLLITTPSTYVLPGYLWSYRHDGNTWQLEEGLVSSNQVYSDFFGKDVALDGDTAVVGAECVRGQSGKDDGAAYFFPVGPLALYASPKPASAGNPLTFDACRGQPATRALLVVTDVSGMPMFQLVAQGTFDASGEWSLPATVPPGLSGLVMQLVALGQTRSGKVHLSNAQTVPFL